MNSKYLIFEVAGDPMKDVVATAVATNLKKKFSKREIIITTLNPEIWLHHPNVYRVYRLGATQYFFEDYIKDKDTLVFRLDPFLTEDFIYRRKHLIEIWSELCEMPFEIKKPLIQFTAREIEATGKMIKRDKPLFLFETRALLNNPLFDPWKAAPQIASLPFSTTMAVVSAMRKEGYYPLHIKKGDEAALPDIEWINLPIRQIMCAISLSQKNLFLNSFGLQTAAALGVSAAAVSTIDDWKVWGYADQKQTKSAGATEIINQLLS